ncbi:MAG: LCP family protein [Pelolinea sp.]|nr:LCP family protein [Pelolinea sp.]
MNQHSNEQTRKIKLNSESTTNQEARKSSQGRAARSTGRKRLPCGGCGCLSFFFLIALLLYLIAPFGTQFLILGIDRSPQNSMAGRSDTIMLVSVNPLLPTVKLLSIPRDLWVTIPGFGENRINAAHFFAEAQEPNTGPDLALETIKSSFGIDLRYYVRFNLEGFPEVVESMGGIRLNLPEPMAGLPAGPNQLDGTQALAFLRSRSDGDDFFRIQQGQIFVTAFIRQLLNPSTWPRIPQILSSFSRVGDTNLPVWLLPRLILAFVRASFTGIETLSIDRSMVAPTVTSEGAQVLLPNWDLILPYLGNNF